MIPQFYITEWRAQAPWRDQDQIEQDLIISRALLDIFSDDYLKEHLAFRGGTALFKLHLVPASRYSEDLDFVQVKGVAIGETINRLRKVLDPWLGSPKRNTKDRNIQLMYRFRSENDTPLRLKVEINSREHFTVLGHEKVPFEVKNQWITGTADITSFKIEELLGTKMRALYQRKKGRDLFDLWLGLTKGNANASKILKCYQVYMSHGKHKVTSKDFILNMDSKIKMSTFLLDTDPILREDLAYNPQVAYEVVKRELLEKL